MARKILFVGQLGVGQTSRMRMEVLRHLGQEVIPLDSAAIWARASWLGRRLEEAAGTGPTVHRLNRALLELARAERPDLLWAEKQEYLSPDTLESLRRLGVRLLHFTPDPYFTLSWKRTRLADACLPLYDHLIFCKRYEEAEYRRVSRGQLLWMPLGFDELVHRPLCPADRATERRFASDIGFVGGWEPRRERLLDALTRAALKVAIWGYAWDHLVDGRWTLRRAVRLRRLAGDEPVEIVHNAALGRALRGGEVYGDTYAWALSGAKIGVGFLRTVWPDQHTTRSFEIPACRSLLLADRTEEHRALFEEGKEAEFFSSETELVDKARFYLRNEAARERVAEAGYLRCHRSGYSYRERLEAVLGALG